MRKKFLAALSLLCLLVLTVPHNADARAGSGGSMGSKGGHTYNAGQGAPIQRSMTPPPSAAPRPAYTPPPMAAPAASPSFFGAHPFLSSMAGGFLGAGLFNMLFGHSAMAGTGVDPNAVAGAAGGGGMGMLLPLLLIGGIGFLAYKLFSQRSAPMGGMASPFASPFAAMNAPQADASFAAAPMGNDQGVPLTLTASDYQAFPPLLEKIQTVWGAADMDHLRQYLTPEMLHYFNQELSANSSRGLVNKVEQVKALSGDLIEAWSEDAMDYATVHLKWSAVDYLARLDKQPTDADYVASGSASAAVEAEEIWTFTRARNGGHWVLSAIQQVG